MEKEPLLRIMRKHVMTVSYFTVTGFILVVTLDKKSPIPGLWPWVLILGLIILIGILALMESLDVLKGKAKS